jgi:hypothetical protein
MPEPSPLHPFRGYSPFRALALRLREQFHAEDEARAAALEASLARRDAARAAHPTALASRAAVAGATPAPAPTPRRAVKKRPRRLVH